MLARPLSSLVFAIVVASLMPTFVRADSVVVFNEIMYNPISGDDDDEYVELYNRAKSAVDLSGWSFVSGIEFTFPHGTRMAAESYLVLARNAARLRSSP